MKHKFRIVEIISHNFWLKVLSFILAVATWFYVFDVVYPVASQQKREALEEVLERYNFTLKEVPVRAVLTGTAPEGYRVVFDKVKVEPSVIAIYGPEELIDKAEELKTETVNIGEYTRSTQLRLGVTSDIKPLRFKEKIVTIYIPVEKLGEE